eukprot:GHVT01087701.1.p2 GENE.GHVT01087701.1~~GHVT01087701.1.p2  ORF type:complete len:129 (-),score=15.85 GHVT01087701.1:1381-1767(-)
MEHANGQRQEAWPHPSIGVTEQNGDRWHAGWSVRDLIQYPRRLHIDGRAVGLWYHEGTAYAMDANCYHAGGALENAVRDIEDIDGQKCIRCPMHQYIISLDTGEGFFQVCKPNLSPYSRYILVGSVAL